MEPRSVEEAGLRLREAIAQRAEDRRQIRARIRTLWYLALDVDADAQRVHQTIEETHAAVRRLEQRIAAGPEVGRGWPQIDWSGRRRMSQAGSHLPTPVAGRALLPRSGQELVTLNETAGG